MQFVMADNYTGYGLRTVSDSAIRGFTRQIEQHRIFTP